MSAISGFSRFPSRMDADILLELIKDPDLKVRRAAAVLLRRCKVPTGALIKLLRDEDRVVRASAHLALRRATGQRYWETEIDKWEAWWRKQKEDRRPE